MGQTHTRKRSFGRLWQSAIISSIALVLADYAPAEGPPDALALQRQSKLIPQAHTEDSLLGDDHLLSGKTAPASHAETILRIAEGNLPQRKLISDRNLSQKASRAPLPFLVPNTVKTEIGVLGQEQEANDDIVQFPSVTIELPPVDLPPVELPAVELPPVELPPIEPQPQSELDFDSDRYESTPAEPVDFVAAKGEQPIIPDPDVQPSPFQPPPVLSSPSDPELLSPPQSNADSLPPPNQSFSKNKLTLAEAVRLGLEYNKEVVVLSFDPSIEATGIETAKAPFDAVSGANSLGGRSDVQVRSLIQTFGAPADFLDTNFLQPFLQPNNLYTKRRLYSGGEVELGFSTNYEDFFPVGPQLIVNPGWNSALNFRYDQSLFAGRGTDFTMAPIRIAQANQNQSQLEFQAEIRNLTRDIELAYWELAGADLALQAYEGFLARGKEMFENQLKRVELGKSALPDVLQTKNLLEEFEVQTADQLQRRNVAEDNLRRVLGLPAQGERTWFACNGEPNLVALPLAAVDNESAYDDELPWEEYVRTAQLRPELLAQQAAIRAAQINVTLAQNQMLPDVSARANYSANGLAPNLADSIATIGRNEYKTWSVGLVYERPLGLRAQQAALRRAKLTLTQETTELDRIRHDILHSLRRSEDITLSTNSLYKLRQKRVVTAKAQMEAFDALYFEDRTSLFIRLDSERNLASAQAELAHAWTRRQLAVVERNYEANLLSPMCRVEIDSHAEPPQP